MKIVQIDNFNRDYISDILIAENVNEYYATRIVKFLNTDISDYNPQYYTVKPDDYKLYKWEP